MLTEKRLLPPGFWGPFKMNSVTLNKHAHAARNKVDFLTVAPEKKFDI